MKSMHISRRIEAVIAAAIILGTAAKFCLAEEMVAGPLASLRSELKQEVNDSKSREQMETIGVQDLKLGEYQDGKSLTDVHGNRVRLEQYILVPQPNQIEFLTYTKRDTGVDTLKAVYTLNKDIPVDLETNAPDIRRVGELDPNKWDSGALSDITAPEFYAKSIDSRVSNDKGDSVAFQAENGDLYKVPTFTDLFNSTYKYDVIYENSYIKLKTAANSDDITKVRLAHVGGTAGTATLGTLEYYLPKYQSTTNELSKTVTVDPSKRDSIYNANGKYALVDGLTWAHTTCDSYWDGTKVNDINAWSDMTLSQLINKKLDWTNTVNFADGTSLSHRETWIKDDGEQLSLGSFVNMLRSITPDNWAVKLSELNHEGIWTATEFGSRSIDVIWSPSIFVKVATSDLSKNK
ncbi:MAG: hypothetical protein A2297_00520 [Elusimicrobia bacterium RIFOXYB2_FULL_48_7]|nr:MAG: hypothetical protein A2297_00520 [Elusimicrobia bacterium RIFOXYB2_FULL_48_7]